MPKGTPGSRGANVYRTALTTTRAPAERNVCAMNSKLSTFRSHGARKNLLEIARSINISSLRDEEAFSRPHSFCPLKFAVQLNRLAVWHNESELYDMLVRVNHREHHAFHQSAFRAAADIEEVKLYAFSIGRHFPFHV